ncbi:MAG: response regulator [bacterium]
MPKNVFIVEDENDVAELYAEIVELHGHVVVGTASDGEEAVRKFALLTRRPDVIIMDYRIPLRNGAEAAREILRIDPGARFIFATADRSAEKEVTMPGVVAFKKKPFDVDRLVKNIEKA